MSVADNIESISVGEVCRLVERLLVEVENLRAEVDDLKTRRTANDAGVLDARRAVPTATDPAELAELGEWVDSLMVRYASAGDWLRPCWWRHGFVVEELTALRVAWLAAFDTDRPAEPTARIRWHDEAGRCRERIRRTISTGPGCTTISHKPDQPMSDDPRWSDEQTERRIDATVTTSTDQCADSAGIDRTGQASFLWVLPHTSKRISGGESEPVSEQPTGRSSLT